MLFAEGSGPQHGDSYFERCVVGSIHRACRPIVSGLPRVGNGGAGRVARQQYPPAAKIRDPYEIRRPRAHCKIPAVWNFQGPFPLTPALSLREREKQGLRRNNSKRLVFSNALPTMLPLPGGRGLG